ncbi:MAG: hypothetical protein LQ347_002430 [Umbilicaria vellea]|nr:MAG: hypothetical protein LQ347_002430 [Umbilicaria vellea]
MTAPINPPAFGNYHVLGEPAWDGWNPGTNSGGGPSKLSLNDQGNDGQVNWLQSDPLPGPVDHIAGCIPNMPAYNVPLSALDEVILPEVNPNRGGIQGLHPAGNYSHQLGQLLSRVEVPGNGLPISGSEGTGQPVRATKDPGAPLASTHGLASFQREYPGQEFGLLSRGSEYFFNQVPYHTSDLSPTSDLTPPSFNHSPPELPPAVVGSLAQQNAAGDSRPPRTTGMECKLPGSGCFQMDSNMNILESRKKKRPYTDVEKERIKKVRAVGACKKCASCHRRCTHVALDDNPPSTLGGHLGQMPSKDVPDVPQGACQRTPELVNAAEDSPETSPSDDCPAPITPASQDSDLAWIADLRQDLFSTTSFYIPGQGDPLEDILAYH